MIRISQKTWSWSCCGCSALRGCGTKRCIRNWAWGNNTWQLVVVGHNLLAGGMSGLSKHMATPWPPPMHNVARPRLARECCISWSRSTTIRQPDAPIGCPIAMAPPFTLTFAGSQPISLFTARACAAKASFASMMSRSLTVHPALSRHFFEAGMGPVPITFGSTPALAKEQILASGTSPRALAFASDMTRHSAAPSLMPEAFPAVTLPPCFLNAGLSLPKESALVSPLMYSSWSKTFLPASTFTICFWNLPAFWAAAAFRWDSAAKASCACLSMPCSAATFSAVTPMW
mmetsp:Transcript_39174/g.101311  ORF Transcript_39174/g.101311 Transcript_39174/m.101311 type:complete len:288 (+) Transcript_39174:65-928(+)